MPSSRRPAAADGPSWSVVVPVKRLTAAKSRLLPQAGRVRSRLALAFACDTIEAALACPLVGTVVAVTSDPLAAIQLQQIGAQVVADGPEAGLNPALNHGVRAARQHASGDAVAALSADLPALRPDQLGLALSIAAAHRRAFVADAAGSGTTLLTSARGAELRPRFGPASAQRHLRGGAYPIEDDGLESLRRDVDTAADLRAARLLGLGRRTSALIEDLRTAS